MLPSCARRRPGDQPHRVLPALTAWSWPRIDRDRMVRHRFSSRSPCSEPLNQIVVGSVRVDQPADTAVDRATGDLDAPDNRGLLVVADARSLSENTITLARPSSTAWTAVQAAPPLERGVAGHSGSGSSSTSSRVAAVAADPLFLVLVRLSRPSFLRSPTWLIRGIPMAVGLTLILRL